MCAGWVVRSAQVPLPASLPALASLWGLTCRAAAPPNSQTKACQEWSEMWCSCIYLFHLLYISFPSPPALIIHLLVSYYNTSEEYIPQYRKWGKSMDNHQDSVRIQRWGDWHQGLKQIPTWRHIHPAQHQACHMIFVSIIVIDHISLESDLCSDSVWGVAVRCALLCILTGVTWWCLVQGSQVNLVHPICVCTTCIGLVSGNPCRGCCVCRGSFNLCMYEY